MSNEKRSGFDYENALESSITADDCEIIRNFHSFFKLPITVELSSALGDFEKRPSRQTLETLRLEVAKSLCGILENKNKLAEAGLDSNMVENLESTLFAYLHEDAKGVADELQFERDITKLLSEQNTPQDEE